MNDQEIGTLLMTNLKDGKLVEVEVIGGPTNSFRLVFENGAEERACLAILPSLKTEIVSGSVVVRPVVNFNVETFKK
ncbi:MAG: hypothetical protein ABID84_06055 [Chloroflexota bacterium]